MLAMRRKLDTAKVRATSKNTASETVLKLYNCIKLACWRSATSLPPRLWPCRRYDCSQARFRLKQASVAQDEASTSKIFIMCDRMWKEAHCASNRRATR